MILAYRTVHNPVDFDQIIDIRWFKDRAALHALQEKWRGDTWIEVTIDMPEQNDVPVEVSATTVEPE